MACGFSVFSGFGVVVGFGLGVWVACGFSVRSGLGVWVARGFSVRSGFGVVVGLPVGPPELPSRAWAGTKRMARPALRAQRASPVPRDLDVLDWHFMGIDRLTRRVIRAAVRWPFREGNLAVGGTPAGLRLHQITVAHCGIQAPKMPFYGCEEPKNPRHPISDPGV